MSMCCSPFLLRSEGSSHVAAPASFIVNSDHRMPAISSRRAPVSISNRTIRS
jgi:hypothetical protein